VHDYGWWWGRCLFEGCLPAFSERAGEVKKTIDYNIADLRLKFETGTSKCEGDEVWFFVKVTSGVHELPTDGVLRL
jgi:hypothetical protein